ncbi:hypothetical protein ACIBK8_28340 [Streptomyces sp. NPDC050161]|uniref:hypothetical protein n=1 Tax=Streptomyces sp. NPDC050161 TaxID=3365604 RepID=UPI0037A0BEA1
MIVGTFLAFLLGVLYGSMLLLLGRAMRTTHLPFGPAMLFGVLGGLAFGAGSIR